MSSLKVLKEQLNKFLKTEKPEVIAIKGKWGVGKTYTWNQILLDAKKEGLIALDKYSYVSLFGISSIEELRFSIFEKTINKDILGKKPSLESFKENSASVAKGLGRKHMTSIASILKMGEVVGKAISFLSVNKVIICIDDFERKDRRLTSRQVLGLISQLKEEKDCKIVMILNEDSMSDKDYDNFREKVIDLEIEFNPSPEECSKIVFDEDNKNHKIILEVCNTLKINNIRIISKIKRMSEEFLIISNGFEDATIKSILTSIVLYSWSFYNKVDSKVPNFDYIKSFKSYNFYLNKDNEKNKEWADILQACNYIYTNKVDLEIANSVERGFFDEDKFLPVVEKYNQEILESNSKDQLRSAWDPFHSSFKNNKDEIVNSFYEKTIENLEHVRLNDLIGTVTLLRKLGENNKANYLVDQYTPKPLDIEENHFRHDVKDEYLLRKLEDFQKQRIALPTIEEAIKNMTETSIWSDLEVLALANSSADELYNFFKSIDDRKLHLYVKSCLDFTKISNPTDNYKKIGNITLEALKKIWNESDINKIRLTRYNLNFDNLNTSE